MLDAINIWLEGVKKIVLQLTNQVLYHKNFLNPLLIEKGWFPSSITLIHKLEDNESIDNFMLRCIEGKYYDQIKNDLILKRYPHRKLVFTEAFNLFEEERYIACIPLFLSQIDGIIIESGLKGFFQGQVKIKGGHTAQDLKYIEYLKMYQNRSDNFGSEDALRVFFLSFYASVIEKAGELSIAKESSKIDAISEGFFNRHGILHGNKDYLNYGTKINALKAISLLLFVIQTLDIVHHEL